MKRLGQLVATIKDYSVLSVDDCSHVFTYKLYKDNNGYKIAFREVTQFGGPATFPYIDNPKLLRSKFPPEVDEEVVDCDFARMDAAVEKFKHAQLPIVVDDEAPKNQMPLCLVLMVGPPCARATYRWRRRAPPAGWEVLDEFAKAVLGECRDYDIDVVWQYGNND